jgi:hypothetical protein
MQHEFPKELFIEIANQPDFIGRISISFAKDFYHAEIDILLKESMKIYRHVKSFYNFSSAREAQESSYHHLAHYLKTTK